MNFLNHRLNVDSEPESDFTIGLFLKLLLSSAWLSFFSANFYFICKLFGHIHFFLVCNFWSHFFNSRCKVFCLFKIWHKSTLSRISVCLHSIILKMFDSFKKYHGRHVRVTTFSHRNADWSHSNFIVAKLVDHFVRTITAPLEVFFRVLWHFSSVRRCRRVAIVAKQTFGLVWPLTFDKRQHGFRLAIHPMEAGTTIVKTSSELFKVDGQPWIHPSVVQCSVVLVQQHFFGQLQSLKCFQLFASALVRVQMQRSHFVFFQYLLLLREKNRLKLLIFDLLVSFVKTMTSHSKATFCKWDMIVFFEKDVATFWIKMCKNIFLGKNA